MLSLTYVSSATELLDVPRLRELLAQWWPRNDARELTGMLLYSGGNIIQTLEGPEASVDATFGTIEADPRHRGVIVVLREPISERAFPDWSMGFRHLGADEMAETDRFNPFLQQPPGQGALGSPDRAGSSAHRLLTLFKENMR